MNYQNSPEQIAWRLLTQKSELNLMHNSTSLHTQQATQCVKRRLHECRLVKPMWSNYRLAGCMLWSATMFWAARGSIQKKSSNLKLVEKRVRLHLSHWIACARQSLFAQEQRIISFLCTIIVFVLFIYFAII